MSQFRSNTACSFNILKMSPIILVLWLVPKEPLVLGVKFVTMTVRLSLVSFCILLIFKDFMMINFKQILSRDSNIGSTPCSYHTAMTIITIWPILYPLYSLHCLWIILKKISGIL